MGMEGCHFERLKYKGFGKNIFKDLYTIQEEVGVHMTGFEEETILEENQLEKLKLRRELRILRTERIRMRSQKRWQKVEVMCWWAGFGSCVIWPLRVLCLKT